MSHRRHPLVGIQRLKRVPAFAALFFVLYSLPSYGQQIVDVVIQNYRFQPQEIRIQPGDTVRWLNREKRTSHSIVLSDVRERESERFFPDENWLHRFDKPGIYPYHCGPHPEMTGQVVVVASSPLAACNDIESTEGQKIRIGPDKASVEILQTNTPTKRLTLRPNLLPDIHLLADGRHALLATRDGWIMRLDLQHEEPIAETKLNALVSGTALSATHSKREQLLAVAGEDLPTLVVMDEHLHVLKSIPVRDKTGRFASGLLTIRTAKARNSFITLLAGAPELWEVSYNPNAPEIGLGMVHDFQYREGHFVPGYLNPQRSTLPSLAQDFVLLDSGHEVLTVHNLGGGWREDGNVRLSSTHLDVRKTAMESTIRFLPDNPALSWRQVDPQTLPQNTSKSERWVHKSTFRFSESLLNPAGQTTHPRNLKQACIQQP